MIDWRKSPPHIDFLGLFVSPREVSSVFNWESLRASIKERPEDAVARFINEGLTMLSTCRGGGIRRLKTSVRIAPIASARPSQCMSTTRERSSRTMKNIALIGACTLSSPRSARSAATC